MVDLRGTAFLEDVQARQAEEIVANHLPPQPRADAIRLLREDSDFLESVLRAPLLRLSDTKDHLLALVQCTCSERIHYTTALR
jgi:hypothetical protein